MHGEAQQEYEPFPVEPGSDSAALAREKQHKKDIRRAYRKHRMQKATGAIAIAAGLSTGAYWSFDVMPARAAIEQTEMSIEFVGAAYHAADQSNLVIVNGGTNTLDSTELARSMPLGDIGQVAASRYDQNGYSCKDAGEKKARYAIGRKVVKYVFEYAHSAGGPMALCAVPYVREELDEYNKQKLQQDPAWQPIRYVSLVMDRSPESQLSIQEESRKQAERLREAMSIVPGADVARVPRFIAEMGARREQYAPMYIPIPFRVAWAMHNVIDEKFTGKAATARLIQTQVESINEHRTERDMKKSSEELETQPRVMIGFLSTEGDDDPIVNGPRARMNWAKGALANKLRWFSATVPATMRHDTAMQQPESMARVLFGEVFPQLRNRVGEINAKDMERVEVLAQAKNNDNKSHQSDTSRPG